MNDNKTTESIRLEASLHGVLKLWNEGGEGGKEAVEAFLALSEQQMLLLRAKKILPHIQELSNGFPVTINGDHFEMTGIDNWRIGPFTVEHIWTFEECYLQEFVTQGSFEDCEVILRDGHLIARISLEDYVPCFEAYLKDN
jgi:hypothetical protein